MPVLLERSRPTKDQQRAVHAYIRRQREKGNKLLPRAKRRRKKKKAKEKKKKKKETVEDVKKEITDLEEKLERLKQKKHELFSQFKRALNYENEMKKKQQEVTSLKATVHHIASSF
ncbi:negative regulation of B cell receptor signaling pathway [Desmophyllum pertusum]|uniref:Negative regulation of B cell receptor signaling pathway n=1 Tax=Desmophyllum pertusum TaxID=174260 RepID=A0A9W9ZUG9_9CNID|nr:negative regulation of B cell receptor signaling pathway [Desmophyllum pertusum]